MDQRRMRSIETAAAMADLMEAAARAAGGAEPDPGLLTLSALIVASAAARRAQMTIGTWRALVRWVRLSLRDLPAPSASPAAGAPAASPSAPSAGATPGTEDLSPSAAPGGA